MEIINQKELELRKAEILKKIKEGAIFIHPTDTIYGISCNALNDKAVEKLRKVKEQFDRPFSVWVPSLKWIKGNCLVDQKVEEWLKKLPGPYTLILKLDKKKAVSKIVNLGQDTLGVRLPDHWFGKIVESLGFPIVTTSVNKAGDSFMTDLESMDEKIKPKIDFLIYEGKKEARPSKIIDLVEGKVKER